MCFSFGQSGEINITATFHIIICDFFGSVNKSYKVFLKALNIIDKSFFSVIFNSGFLFLGGRAYAEYTRIFRMYGI